MKYIGHEKIYVLNGGFQEWKKQGFPTDNKVTFYLPTDYHMNIQEQLYADVNDIRKVVAKEKQAVLIDSREKKRYLGEFEPIDPIPGHIPGAINKFWLDGVDPDGKFLDIEKQKERFKDISPDKEIIVYCGSGVTAAPNVLLLNSIGFSKVKLYVGSYSDWVSYQEHPVEKEEPME